MQGNVYFSTASFPPSCFALRLSALGSQGLEGAGEADSWLLHQEWAMVCDLASCIPPGQGTVGQESLSSLGRALRGRACLLGWNLAQQSNWSSLCSLGFDSSPSLFLKKKSSGQVAKKSLFRTEAPLRTVSLLEPPGREVPKLFPCLSTQSSQNLSN